MLETDTVGPPVRMDDHPKNPITAIATVAPVNTGTFTRQRDCTRGTGVVPVGVIPPLGVASTSSCGNRSSALCHRSAAFFSKHFITSWFKAAGTASRCLLTGSGVSLMCAARIICGEVPVKGGRPVSSSYASAPTA